MKDHSHINQSLSTDSSDYYNLENKDGWKSKIKTDKQTGIISEFIEKEGKWFNYIKGEEIKFIKDIDTSKFSFQGIGKAEDIII